jgi:predicted branched-subunit amino acid permease
MSVIVFAGSAQFTAIAIVAAGGTVGAAVVAAALINSRFLPMGVALGPSLPGGPLRRFAQGQAIVDASWALASRGDGTFDRWVLFGSTGVQYVGWVLGTLIGAFGGSVLDDPAALGLDAVYPAFFLALLIHEARDGRARGVAALGAAIALALVPFAPPGVPVLAASLAALVGLTRSARAAARAQR